MQEGLLKTLYISHIDASLPRQDLAILVATCGEINKVRVCGNSKQATYYAFVEFVVASGASKMLAKNKTLFGRFPLHCSISRTGIHDHHPTDSIWNEHEGEGMHVWSPFEECGGG